jgi:hypothetical protein
MDFGEILSKSWKIIWRHKILWLFGFLAGCGRGGGGGGGSGGNMNFEQGKMPFEGQLPPWLEELIRTMERWTQDGTIWYIVAGLVVFILLAWAISVVLSTFGRIGLIRGAWRADEGAEKLRFGELWRESAPYFWRVLLLMILFALAAIIVILAVAAPAAFIAVMTLGIGILCLIPLICILALVLWAASVVLEQVIIAVVLEDLKLGDAVRRGWQIVRSNPGSVAVMALILIIGTGILNLIISLPAILILLPLIIGIVADNQNLLTGGIAVSAALLCVYLPIAILLGSILQAYVGTAWTLVFLRLRRKMEEAAAEIEPPELKGGGFSE